MLDGLLKLVLLGTSGDGAFDDEDDEDNDEEDFRSYASTIAVIVAVVDPLPKATATTRIITPNENVRHRKAVTATDLGFSPISFCLFLFVFCSLKM